MFDFHLNFSSKIDSLRESQNYFQWMESDGNRYGILKQNNTSRATPFFYVFSEEELLGRGTTGEVYKAYQIDPYTKKANENICLAVKISPYDLTKEYQHAKKIFLAFKPIKDKKTNLNFFLMEFIDGDTLTSKKNGKEILNPIVNELNFSERTHLVIQLVSAFNQIHHTTLKGEAVIHGDIKERNILIAKKKIKGKTSLTILPIDFGNSIALLDINQTIDSKILSNHLHLPPEMMSHSIESGKFKVNTEEITGYVGTKSDIYALTPIIMRIYGCVNPYAIKINNLCFFSCDDKHIVSAYKISFNRPFDFKDFLLDVKDIPPEPLLTQLKKFLRKMASFNDKDRPNIDEVLKFFITLYKLSLIENDEANLSEKYISEATLILLNNNLWGDDAVHELMQDTTEAFDKAKKIINLDREQELVNESVLRLS